ncbi:rCG61778 [Rattus norvegicus]|uniref:RCG61778 n=1 Tax=Rattus norvegicus TaxID=10116 RepID=A6HBU0_RAT|nr:rCG61778 [Rattus norvegicus]
MGRNKGSTQQNGFLDKPNQCAHTPDQYTWFSLEKQKYLADDRKLIFVVRLCAKSIKFFPEPGIKKLKRH